MSVLSQGWGVTEVDRRSSNYICYIWVMYSVPFRTCLQSLCKRLCMQYAHTAKLDPRSSGMVPHSVAQAGTREHPPTNTTQVMLLVTPCARDHNLQSQPPLMFSIESIRPGPRNSSMKSNTQHKDEHF